MEVIDMVSKYDGLEVVWLGYLNNKLPDGREIPLDNFVFDSDYDGLAYYDEQTKTKYLIS